MFIGSFTWYILEYDRNTNQFFAFVVSHLVPEGEYGYVSLDELESINVNGVQVDREIYQVNPREPKLLKDLLKQDGVLLR